MADVELRSLRVSAEMDASKYAAGAQQKTAADQKMVQSGRDVAVSVTATETKISQAGDVLARLSRQYVDGYAAQQRFSAGLNQLSTGIERGKISMQQAEGILGGMVQKYGILADASQFASRGQVEFAAAIERANAKQRESIFWHEQWLKEFQKEPVAHGRPVAGNQNTLGAFGAFNTGQQLQDIAVTAAMGQSIPTIALQQGLQLATSLDIQMQNAKAAGLGMAAALRGAFAGLITPVGLLAVGFTAVTAAAIQYFANSTDKSKTLKENLEEQRQLINDIAKAYGEAAVNRDKLLSRSGFALGLEGSARQTEAHQQMLGADKDVLDQLFQVRRGGQFGAFSGTAQQRFADFQEPLTVLRQGLITGNLEVEKFDDLMEQVVRKKPGLKAIAEEIAGITREVIKQNQELGLTAKILADVSARGKFRLHEELAPSASGDETADRVAAANARARAESAASRREIGREMETQRESAMLAAEIAQINARTNAERIAAAKQVEEARFVQGEEEWQKALRVSAAVARETAQAERDLADARRDRQFSREDLIAQGQNDLAVIGQTGGEAARLRKEFELMQELREESRRTGVPVNEAEAAAVRETAKAYGELTEAITRKQLATELAFEKSVAFLNEEDAAIARRQHSLGLPVDLNSEDAGMMRQINQINRIKDTWQDVFDTVNDGIDSMFDSLFEGGKDFEDVLRDIGRQLARMIFDLAITNPLKNFLTGSNLNTIADLGIFGSGASSGRGGGFGGALGQLFGIGGAMAGNAPAGFPAAPSLSAANSNIAGGAAQAVMPNFYFTPTMAARMGLNPANFVPGGYPGPQGLNLGSMVDGTVTGSTGGLTGNMARYAAAIRFNESGSYAGNYSALGPWTNGDRAYGAYQMMGNNIPSWSKKWLGDRMSPSEFLHNPGAQDRIFKGEFGSYVDKWGPDKAANAWFTGSPTGGGKDVLGTSNTTYVKNFERALGGVPDKFDKIAESAETAADGLKGAGLAGFDTVKGLQDAAGGLTQFGSVLKSFMGAGGGSGTGWFQGLSSLFGGAGGALNYMMGISPGATGAILAGGALGPMGLYHEGGIAGSSSMFRAGVDPRAFIGARRYHNGGLAGDEVPAILRRGEPVFRSMDHARQVVGANQNIDLDALANKLQTKLKIVNVFDPSVVGDYLRKNDAGEKAVVNVQRRTRTARGL